MPVLANHKVVEQLYEYPTRQAGGWTVFDTATSRSLHLFRIHHQKCVARRKHALSHELRQESQRTEWLKRKYLDSIRQQQQAISSRVESTSTSSTRGFEMDHGQHVASEQERKHSGSKSVDSPPHNMETNSKRAPTIPADTDVLIKKEPDSDDNLSSPSKVGPELAAFNTTTESLELKRRLSQTTAKTDVRKWGSLNGSEDSQDELRLTAYDVIAGVISTPPIEPLEQDTDISHIIAPRNGVPLPSSSSSKAGESPITPTTSIITSTTTSVALPAKNKKDQQTLDQDLDEFSKVYDLVTQEQKAKERRHSLANELEPAVYPRQRPAHLLDPPPPYLTMGQPGPLQLSSQNNYYQHKYMQLQTPPPSQSQVNSAYQPKNVKPQLILSSACVAGSPTSGANHIPATPTTPLEHFTNFQSSSPHAPPPPPYSSTAVGYSYNHEPVHQTVATSSTGKRWPLSSQQQDSPKETILAHISSHVVALTGQKRPIHEEFNGSILPPTKVLIGNSGHVHGYHHHGLALPLAPPYPGPSAPTQTYPL